MSIFEWIGEAHNPGEIGEISIQGGDRPPRSKLWMLVRLFLTLALIGGLYLILYQAKFTSLKAYLIATAFLLCYLGIGYFLRVNVDTDNIGWAGGLFDHPFRYSDDINRQLIFVMILFWPGRFLAESLVDIPQLFSAREPVRPKRKKSKRRRPDTSNDDDENVFRPI